MCLDDCPSGYFPKVQENKCERCHKNCQTCDGPDADNCISCWSPSSVRYNGACLSTCPSVTYKDKMECRGMSIWDLALLKTLNETSQLLIKYTVFLQKHGKLFITNSVIKKKTCMLRLRRFIIQSGTLNPVLSKGRYSKAS